MEGQKFMISQVWNYIQFINTADKTHCLCCTGFHYNQKYYSLNRGFH